MPGTTQQTPPPAVGVLGLLRFTAELGMLAALGYGGSHLVTGTVPSLLLALGLPLLAAVAWGRWVAPRAGRRLPDPGRLAVEVALFAVALLVLLRAGPNPLAAVLGVGLWALFLVSLPHRRSEAVGPGR